MSVFYVRQVLLDLNEKEGNNIKHLVYIKHNVADIDQIGQLQQLISLDLSDNKLQNIAPLQYLKHINRITLDNNMVQNMGPLAKLQSLTFLSLRNNQVADLQEIKNLGNVPIESLNLHNNPVVDDQTFYSVCLTFLQNLIVLNDEKVREEDKLLDLDKFIDSLPQQENAQKQTKLQPEQWIPDEAFQIVELPEFAMICRELENAINDNITQYSKIYNEVVTEQFLESDQK